MDTADVSCVPADALRNVEADTYWCMSRLLDGIQVSPPGGSATPWRPSGGVHTPQGDCVSAGAHVPLEPVGGHSAGLGGTRPPLQSPIPAGIPPPRPHPPPRPTRPPVTVVLPPSAGRR